MKETTIQKLGADFGCLTVASVIIGIVYLIGALTSLFWGTKAWAIRGFKISAILIVVPLVLWAILTGIVFLMQKRVTSNKRTQNEDCNPQNDSSSQETVAHEIVADIEFTEDTPFREDKYDSVLPVFANVFVECEDNEKSVQDFIRFFINVYGKGVIPYLTRFIAESDAAEHLRNDRKDL